MMGYAVESLAVRTFVSKISHDNVSSRALFEQLGFNERSDPLSGHCGAVGVDEQLGRLTAAMGDQQPVIEPRHGSGMGLILSPKAGSRGIVVEAANRRASGEARGCSYDCTLHTGTVQICLQRGHPVVKVCRIILQPMYDGGQSRHNLKFAAVPAGAAVEVNEAG